ERAHAPRLAASAARGDRARPEMFSPGAPSLSHASRSSPRTACDCGRRAAARARQAAPAARCFALCRRQLLLQLEDLADEPLVFPLQELGSLTELLPIQIVDAERHSAGLVNRDRQGQG